MPFKRSSSPYWQVWVTVPRRGRVGPWSTGTTSKATAEAMEQMLRELPLQGYGEVIDLIPDPYPLPDVYAARLDGGLDALLRVRTDPLLHEAVETVRPLTSERVGYGLDALRELTDPTERFTALLDHKQVRELLRRREAQGVKRNTVRRGLQRAMVEVIRHFASPEDASTVMRRVQYSKEDDERRVHLTSAQVGRLLHFCGRESELFGAFVALAITSGIDRGPLLRIQPNDFDGTVLVVHDTKTRFRHRTIELGQRAQAALRRAIDITGAQEGERVFPWAPGQVQRLWERAREAAALDHVWFKDLRAIFATNFLAGGGSPKDLMHVLGHSNLQSTLRYIRRLPARSGQDMDAAEASLGLTHSSGGNDG